MYFLAFMFLSQYNLNSFFQDYVSFLNPRFFLLNVKRKKKNAISLKKEVSF